MVSDRAYLKGARIGGPLGRLESEVARILAVLGSTGAVRVEPAALQPADVLLDLYGEDIRARAFVTRDEGAEMMLRPDFTVPVARLHMDAGGDPARYVYCGPVWRRQEWGSERPREYLQAGFEVFGEGDPAERDAEVLALVTAALGAAPVEIVTGDLGLILAAIDALKTSGARKAALRRHVWRPARFHALLERYRRGACGGAGDAGRADRRRGRGADCGAGRHRGQRRAARAGRGGGADQAAGRGGGDAAAGGRRGGLDRGGARRSPGRRGRRSRRCAGWPRGGRGSARRSSGSRRGSTPSRRGGSRPRALRFEASFGRTTLEYYDGFVFGALPRGRDDLPPVASGGRYDALTRVLGARARDAGGRRHDPARGAGGADMRLKLGLPSKGRCRRRRSPGSGRAADGGAGAAAGASIAARSAGSTGSSWCCLAAGEIPRELAAGRLHLGVTGQDLVREEIPRWGERLAEVAAMGFGFADLVVAVPAFWIDVIDMTDLDAAAAEFRARHGHRLRVATKYHHLVREFFRSRGVADYQLVDSQGATEGTVKNLTAEAVADITTSGSTLRDNHLRVLEDGLILRSQATLFAARGADWDAGAAAALAAVCDRLGVARPAL